MRRLIHWFVWHYIGPPFVFCFAKYHGHMVMSSTNPIVRGFCYHVQVLQIRFRLLEKSNESNNITLFLCTHETLQRGVTVVLTCSQMNPYIQSDQRDCVTIIKFI